MRRWTLPFVLVCLSFAQDASIRPSIPPFSTDEGIHLTRRQRNDLIKAEHRKNVRDSEALLAMAYRLKSDLEKTDRAAAAPKEIDEIERLAKNIHGRLLKY